MDWHQVASSLDEMFWFYRRLPDLQDTEISVVASLVAFVQSNPPLLEAVLLRELPDQVLAAESLPGSVKRAVAIDRFFPPDLDLPPVVLGVAEGLIRAERTRRELNLSSWKLHEWDLEGLHISRLTSESHHIAALWHALGVLAVLPCGYEVERAGWLRRLEQHVMDHPDSWAQSLGWILKVGPSLEGLDVTVTLRLMDSNPQIADSLRDVANSSPSRMALRAQGIEAIAAGADPAKAQEWLLDAAAMMLDRRRHQFPHPLEAPSTTWLSDLNVESILRGASRRAVEEFADVVKVEGASEEEGLTQNLLSLLVTHMKSAKLALRLAVPAGSVPEIEVERRTLPKSEEKWIGADLGIVVSVDLPRHAQIQFGDLVQVKKSQLLYDPGQAPGVRADSWRIDIAQLEVLLRCSATAVYWLIAQDGKIHVVPAKMLLALGRGRGKLGAISFTARYIDIRHAAIPLGNYLCDVLIGMWTASTNAETLAIADGSNSRTRPRNLFSIAVRIADQ